MKIDRFLKELDLENIEEIEKLKDFLGIISIDIDFNEDEFDLIQNIYLGFIGDFDIYQSKNKEKNCYLILSDTGMGGEAGRETFLITKKPDIKKLELILFFIDGLREFKMNQIGRNKLLNSFKEKLSKINTNMRFYHYIYNEDKYIELFHEDSTDLLMKPGGYYFNTRLEVEVLIDGLIGIEEAQIIANLSKKYDLIMVKELLN